MSRPCPVEEDTFNEPETSKQEITAFYIYNIALSGVGQLGLVVVFPLILNALASGVGYIDGTTFPCSERDALIANQTYTLQTMPSCMVDMGSITLNTASYTNYVISFSVFLQALLYISIASFGDYGNWRKKFLIIFGILGCTSTMVMPVANEPSLYWLAGVFVILANLFQGVSYVFLDGYFPLLVRNDAAVRQGTLSFDERANRVQAIGMVSGFSTGIFFEGVTFAVLALLSQSTSTLQWMVCATGVWWLVLGIYTFMFLKERPGPPLPSGHRNYIFFSWSSVFKSISKWRKIPNTFLFLLAFFMFSDGLHTLAQFATVFCHDKLGLTNSETILVSILFPIAAALGNVALIFVQKRFQISTRMMLFSCLLVMTLVPFYALIGAFNDSFGLVHQWEAYLMAVWFGSVFGAIQSFGKVLYSEMIPRGCESEFFALAAISDRGASWIGPLIVAGVTQVSHDIRFGLFSISFLFIVALPLVYFINPEKGKLDAKIYGIELAKEKGLEASLYHAKSTGTLDLEMYHVPTKLSRKSDEFHDVEL